MLVDPQTYSENHHDCGKKGWELNVRGLRRVSRTMCVLIFCIFTYRVEKASTDLMSEEYGKSDIKF